MSFHATLVYVSKQSKYEMGQIIKKGNKTYQIIGLDDPNDPDIEEVK